MPASGFVRRGAAAAAADAGVADVAAKPTDATAPTETPYVGPTKDTKDLKVGESNAETRAAASQESALTLF